MQRQNHHNLQRICIAFICLVFCVVSGTSRKVMAGERTYNEMYYTGISTGSSVDTDMKGSIRLEEMHGEGIEWSIYQIGVFSNKGDVYYTDEIGAYIQELTVTPSSDNTTQEAEQLASDFLSIIRNHNLKPLVENSKTGADGSVTFEGLTPGWYLLIAESFTNEEGKEYSANPILLSLPGESTQWAYHATVNAKSQLITPPENPDNPPQDSEHPKTNKPVKKSSGSRLPQTGVLWWPVAVLTGAGLLLCLIGMVAGRRKDRKPE